MIFWMDSKTFQDVFLNNEDDDDILDTQYVIISSRIKTRKAPNNIISAYSTLYPDSGVCMSVDQEVFEDRYFNQLDENVVLIASIIKYALDDNKNIVFICSKSEKKLHFMDTLEYYIHIKFNFPIYKYKDYANGLLKEVKFDKKAVLDKCNKILKKAEKKKINKLKSTEKGRKALRKEYEEKSKKELKKILKKKGINPDNLTKEEMLDMIDTFC